MSPASATTGIDFGSFAWPKKKSSKKKKQANSCCCRRKRCRLPQLASSRCACPPCCSALPPPPPLLTTFCACEFVSLIPPWAAACEMQPNPQAAAIQIALPSAQRKSNCLSLSLFLLPYPTLRSFLIKCVPRVGAAAAPMNTHNLLMKLNVFILCKLMEIFA